jgi:hypothetical protein
MANVELSATTTTNSNENGGSSNTQSNGCFVQCRGELPTNVDKFNERISELKSDSEGVWLVIGEALRAHHALTRFSKKNWIFLDPHYKRIHSDKIEIEGFIQDLYKLPIIKGSITYIVDDPHILCGEKYADHMECGSTFDNLMILHDFLVKGGVITTSIWALNQLSEEELAKIREKFTIKWSYEECDFSKPYKDCPFAEKVSKSHFRSRFQWYSSIVRLKMSCGANEKKRFSEITNLDRLAEIIPVEKYKILKDNGLRCAILAERLWGSKTFGGNYEQWSRPEVDTLSEVDEPVVENISMLKDMNYNLYDLVHKPGLRKSLLSELSAISKDLEMYNGSLFFIKKD